LKPTLWSFNREEAKRKLLESNLEVLKEELARSRATYMEAQRELDMARSEHQVTLQNVAFQSLV
jgi:hypothetical protein